MKGMAVLQQAISASEGRPAFERAQRLVEAADELRMHAAYQPLANGRALTLYAAAIDPTAIGLHPISFLHRVGDR